MATMILKTAAGSTAITVDPDDYSRILYGLGKTRQTQSGQRRHHKFGIHYDLSLDWNYLTDTEYTALRELYYAGEKLYLDDGNVPPLIETGIVRETATYTYTTITRPSTTHQAYFRQTSAGVSAKDSLEQQEVQDADYLAIDADDASYVGDTALIYASPGRGYYPISEQWFDAGDVLDGGTDIICFSAWVRFDTDNSGGNFVYKFGAVLGYQFATTSGSTPDTLFGAAVGAGGTFTITGTTDIEADNEWHHVAIVIDPAANANCKVYLDGSDDTASRTGDVTAIGDLDNVGDMRIGQLSDKVVTDGMGIRNARIYIHASLKWSDANIAAQALDMRDSTAGGTNTSNWTFEEADSATTIDDQTASNDLSLVGGDTTNYGTHSRVNGTTEYLYHKLNLLSGIQQVDVKRVKITVAAMGTNEGLGDGFTLFGWRHDTDRWMELGHVDDAGKTDLEYNITFPDIAMQFVDKSDNYARFLVRTRQPIGGSPYDVELRTYYAELIINENMDIVIELTHTPILSSGDVIWVKNLTQGTVLALTTDYTISGREITVSGQSTDDVIEVKYNRYHEVSFASLPDTWIDGDPASSRYRTATIRFRSLTQNEKNS